MLTSAIRREKQTENEFATLRRRLQSWLRRRPQRQLRLAESLSLGEKRFVAVVQFEQMRFLLGGTASSIALISQLPDTRPIAEPCEDEARL